MQIGDRLVQILQLQISPSIRGTYTQIIGQPRLINVLDRLIQINKLFGNLLLRLLGILDGLGLKLVNPGKDGRDIISNRLERFGRLFNLINDTLVLQDGAVVCEIDGFARGTEMIEFGVGVDIAFSEGGEGRGCLWSQRKGGCKSVPVDFCDCLAG